MSPFYKDYSSFLAEHFDGKIQKICIDLGTGCPNRDGTLGTGGCIYCLNPAFSPDWGKRKLGVKEQIERGRAFFARKYPSMRYLAYFQSETSTHTSMAILGDAIMEAVKEPDIVGIIISTRPDCVPQDLIELLCSVRESSGKKVFMELGAESSHDSTLAFLNRCHTWAQVVDAVKRLHEAEIPVGLHLILGLPGEDELMMEETVRRTGELPVSTVKFHHLQVLRGTPLARMFEDGTLPHMLHFEPEQYARLCVRLLKFLPKNIAIERFVAQAQDKFLIAPRWNLKNYEFSAILDRAFRTSSSCPSTD